MRNATEEEKISTVCSFEFVLLSPNAVKRLIVPRNTTNTVLKFMQNDLLDFSLVVELKIELIINEGH